VTDPEPTPPSPAPPPALPGAAAFLGMGLSAAACVAVGVVLGVWADSTWHTAPAFFVVGLLLGLGAATWGVVAQIRRYL